MSNLVLIALLLGIITLKLGSFSSLLSQILLLVSLYILGAIALSILDFYFLALAYIIVYVGAIAILFIFIILASGGNIATNKGRPLNFSLGYAVFLIVALGQTYLTPGPGLASYTLQASAPNWYLSYWYLLDIQSIGIYLINGWYLAILLVGILLTVILIGILDATSSTQKC